MRKINNFEKFLEEMNNPNTPQGYISSLSNKPKLKPQQTQQNKNQQQRRPTDEVDDILLNTEEQKQKIIAQKDMIEKGLLNNIRDMEPENQKDVKTQVKEYGDQVKEFDKTVNQIGQLNKKLKDSDKKIRPNPSIKNARDKNNF
jgi:hypothetical protein